jgi:hypothetical protein
MQLNIALITLGSLDSKIASAEFNLTQLRVGREAFMKMLKDALEQKPEEA